MPTNLLKQLSEHRLLHPIPSHTPYHFPTCHIPRPCIHIPRPTARQFLSLTSLAAHRQELSDKHRAMLLLTLGSNPQALVPNTIASDFLTQVHAPRWTPAPLHP